MNFKYADYRKKVPLFYNEMTLSIACLAAHEIMLSGMLFIAQRCTISVY